MNRKQFFALVIVGLVVGGVAYYYAAKRKQSYTTSDFKEGQKVVPNFPLNDVAHVRIRGATGEVNVVREGEQWVVRERYNYPASVPEVAGFLRKIWELKPVQEMAVGPSQFGRLDLVPPGDAKAGSTNSATLVEFKGADNKNLQTILLGKKYVKDSGGASPFGGGGDFPVGRYLTVTEQNPPRVWLVSETFANIEPNPDQWLNKDFFKIEKIKSFAVNHPEETNSWSLLRDNESADWKFAEAKENESADKAKTSSLNYAFNSPTFNDVANPDAKPESLGLDKPITARVETFDGFIYNFKLGTNAGEEAMALQVNVDGNINTNRPVAVNEKPEDKAKLETAHKENIEKLQTKLKKEQAFGKWTYLVNKWTVDTLLKTRKDFVAEEKREGPESNSDAPNGALPQLNPADLIPNEIKQLPIVPQQPTEAPASDEKSDQ
ncbi:MAG: DUF4340 domain-containing protein [Verrucomicrobiales bacterium]